MSTAPKRPTFISAVFYKDPLAALDWLERAFGFERRMLITDADGNLAHSEMDHGDGTIMVGSEWTDYIASPANTGGRNTQNVHVQVTDGIDALFARATAAGAGVARPLEDQFYGDRTFSVRDPEGHVWSFAQTTEIVTREEAEQRSGLKIDGWTDSACP
ncbi:VOC family protein [Zavarzinia sp. CC-PAN008]|uniref:VOC family protein n=1 Tax=Zavarzinia sp. CC-PAN008 TaxID=3243332 RepID=UPI003F74204A